MSDESIKHTSHILVWVQYGTDTILRSPYNIGSKNLVILTPKEIKSLCEIMELMLLDFFEESMVVSFDGDEAWLSTEN